MVKLHSQFAFCYLENKQLTGSQMAFRARNVFGTFEKRPQGPRPSDQPSRYLRPQPLATLLKRPMGSQSFQKVSSLKKEAALLNLLTQQTNSTEGTKKSLSKVTAVA